MRYFDCSACFCAHGCSCGEQRRPVLVGRPCSAACRCGSPVPPNHRSSFGLARSAAICANDSPEPFSVIATLMPVSFSNSVAARLHHSACTGQITLSCACARGSATRATAARATAAIARSGSCAAPVRSRATVMIGHARRVNGESRRAMIGADGRRPHRHRPRRHQDRDPRARRDGPRAAIASACRRRRATTTRRSTRSPRSCDEADARAAASARASASARPGSISRATGLLRSANSVCLNGRRSARTSRARSAATCAIDQRRELLRAVRSGRRRGRGRRGRVRRDPRHRRRRGHRRARPRARRAERHRGRVGPQPAAVAARRRAARPGVLLRPARLHRDVPVGPGPRARSPRARPAPIVAPEAIVASRGAPATRVRSDARALRGAPRARARARDQHPRSRRDRARRRPVEPRPALRVGAAAVGRRGCSRDRVDTRLVRHRARRLERRARRGVAVARREGEE